MSPVLPSLEFRLPIAPTPSFYHRIRFFCAALRRLGPGYADAPVQVTVGDRADMKKVGNENRWSENFPIQWHRVPDELCEKHGYFGTSDFRYFLPESKADLVILADADTAVVRPLGDALTWMLRDEASIAGHMAHGPPPVTVRARPEMKSADLWPYLFGEFSIPWPGQLSGYSMDREGRLPLVPAYYNLGFVVLNRTALALFRERIAEIRDHLNAIVVSEMRCQMAVTLLSYRHGMQRQNLSADFNAANDERHLAHNQVSLEDIRVIHYLRPSELDRESFLGPDQRDHFLRASLHNPVNRLLQDLAREIFAYGCESDDLAVSGKGDARS